MKKITMSILSFAAVSSMAFASENSSFYVGGGFSFIDLNAQEIGGSGEFDITGDSLTLIAGYNLNSYFAIEGRYTGTVGDLSADIYGYEEDLDGGMSNIAVYLKPMFPVQNMNLYALLGLGQVTLDDDSSDDLSETFLQWGLGINYGINDNFGVFLDYVRLYDDVGFDGDTLDGDFVVDTVNIGVTYKF